MTNNAQRHLIKIILLSLVIPFLIFLVPYTYSRYESVTETDVNSRIAYYVLDTSYSTNDIHLSNLVPSDDPYVYTFTIANNDGTNRLEMRLKYDLTIKTTTNLPLSFELYMNEEPSNPTASSIITSTNVVSDSYGTYFKEMKTPTSYFNFVYDEENVYTLLVYFPKQYISSQYQDMIDSVELIIDSKQILE